MKETVTYGQRLSAWRKQAGLTQRALGAAMGVSQGYISDIESGRSGPSRDFLQALTDAFGVSQIWILDGREPMTYPNWKPGFQGTSARIAPVDRGRPMAGDFEADGVGFSLIRRFDLTVSAGNGLLAVDGAEKDRLAFSNSWLSRMGIAADLAALVSVRGDSMAPTIPDGATVLIDAREKSVQGGGVFAFTFDGEVYVKRLAAAKGSSAISMTSDNPAYQARVLVGAEMKQLRIAGRVRLVIATL
jgi:phage repressor protein C with HTH and peptisase S24 domain